jgi:hypothetical protein
MSRFRRTPARAPVMFVLSLLALLALTPAALGGPAKDLRAHAASSFLTGIGDEQPLMFANPLYVQLHTKIARYVTPYDAAVSPADLQKAKVWIADAEADHQQVLVAFYHSERTPTRLPSVASYESDVAKFVKDFPNVHQYQSWDEANRGSVPHQFSSPSAVSAAKYYQALKRVCHGCTVIGLDVLDQAFIQPTLRYITEFKREIKRLETVMPTIWGLHNYSDVNRLESWRTRQLIKAFGGQVWLTETGGLVQFPPSFLNRHGAGLTRAAKVIKFTFALAGGHSQIKRLYLYDWTDGTAPTRFEAGLTNAHQEPRAGYVVVCKALHAAKCDVKLATN